MLTDLVQEGCNRRNGRNGPPTQGRDSRRGHPDLRWDSTTQSTRGSMVAEAILTSKSQEKCSSWTSSSQNFACGACNGYVTVRIRSVFVFWARAPRPSDHAGGGPLTERSISLRPTTGYHGLLRPSTRNSRCHTQPHGQRKSGPHTAAHRLAQASLAACATPKGRGSTAASNTPCRPRRPILRKHGGARLHWDGACQ